MIYLDYAANTPVDPEVLESFSKAALEFPGNPNSNHPLGVLAKEKMDDLTKEAASLLNVLPEEIIFTSGASESNNLAIKGIAHLNKNRGKHIISTCLEHSSVSGALSALQNEGFEIDLVDITEDGTIDLEHLRELLRKDTILVTIGYVDSELGVVQPVNEIGRIVKQYENCAYHVDATQAVGKVPLELEQIDLLTFAPHKFYGINGCGVLVRKQHVILEPLIHGGVSSSLYRSGTPCVGHAAATVKALELALANLETRNEMVVRVRRAMEQELTKYPLVRINSPEQGVPHILNASVKGVKAALWQEEMSKAGVCISTKSACSVPGTPSRAVFAITRDKKNAMCSWRISLSHLTKEEEVKEFFEVFQKSYERMTQ